jgi:hypothetical protein
VRLLAVSAAVASIVGSVANAQPQAPSNSLDRSHIEKGRAEVDDYCQRVFLGKTYQGTLISRANSGMEIPYVLTFTFKACEFKSLSSSGRPFVRLSYELESNRREDNGINTRDYELIGESLVFTGAPTYFLRKLVITPQRDHSLTMEITRTVTGGTSYTKGQFYLRQR